MSDLRSLISGFPGLRLLISGLCALFLALSFGAHAQESTKLARVGFLIPGTQSAFSVRTDAIRQGLRDLGYVEGKNLRIEYRYSEGKTARLAELAAELTRLNPDLIFAIGTDAAKAAKSATKTIPIVATLADPVGSGVIASLARPGGNITGLSILSPELSGKRLELLKETVPKMSRVAVLLNPATPNTPADLKETESAARTFSVEVRSIETRSADQLDDAFAAINKTRAHALLVLTDVMLLANRKQIVQFATASRLPVMYYDSSFVEAGGLMSYGASITDLFRRAATYIDKILKGTKPADLPVEQPNKFELIVNLKTAKQIGVTIPPNVLTRADRVIK